MRSRHDIYVLYVSCVYVYVSYVYVSCVYVYVSMYMHLVYMYMYVSCDTFHPQVRMRSGHEHLSLLFFSVMNGGQKVPIAEIYRRSGNRMNPNTGIVNIIDQYNKLE